LTFRQSAAICSIIEQEAVTMPGPGGKAAQLKNAVIRAQLEASLREWWANETSDWDALVEGAADGAGGTAAANTGPDLWGSMPVVDSKAVARTAPIFEKHLGVPLDTSLIRPGGYTSIDAVIDDLIPKMLERQGSVSGQVA
jgi:hypothetical protein